MVKTVVIIQSNYLPWRGYFDLIRRADQAILFDSVQYTRRDWRNRNRIKTPHGPQWITVPVVVKGRYLQSVAETEIATDTWAEDHIRTLELAYRRAAGFSEVAPWLFCALSAAAKEVLLSRVNERLLSAIAEQLGIDTPVVRCTDVLDRGEMAAMEASERLVALCGAVGATHYLSGPAAKAYLDERRFAEAGLSVAWMDYGGYPEYPQLWGPYDPYLSVVDLLLNVGRDAGRYLAGR